MSLVYPKQSDEYDVDVFNNNFKELKNNIDENETNTANNLATKASVAYVEEAIGDMQVDVDDLRDTVSRETDSLSERITAETAARVNADNTINGILENKADSVHTHSADDIDTGILPVERGGTGNTSVDTTPTSGSTKMVTSGGVYEALGKLPIYIGSKSVDTDSYGNSYLNIDAGLPIDLAGRIFIIILSVSYIENEISLESSVRIKFGNTNNIASNRKGDKLKVSDIAIGGYASEAAYLLCYVNKNSMYQVHVINA